MLLGDDASEQSRSENISSRCVKEKQLHVHDLIFSKQNYKERKGKTGTKVAEAHDLLSSFFIFVVFLFVFLFSAGQLAGGRKDQEAIP